MDDPAIAEEAGMIALRDQWLIEKGKAGPATKARVKKAATAEKKLIEQQEMLWQKNKAKSKDQGLQMKKLALGNRRAAIGTFKAVLSGPISPPDEQPSSAAPSIEDRVAARSSTIEKKKAASKILIHRLSGRLAASKTLTQHTPRSSVSPPPPPAMELIRPGKRKVRIPPNAVESTPRKRMRRQDGQDGTDD